VIDVDNPKYREIFHGVYRIIYHYAGVRVTIITVLHGSRRWSTRFLSED